MEDISGNIDTLILNILLYADDIALITESETDIQLLLDIVQSWCKCWRLDQGRIFYIICGYSSGKSFRILLSLLNKLGRVTLFWSFLSGKSLQFSGKYSPLRTLQYKSHETYVGHLVVVVGFHSRENKYRS